MFKLGYTHSDITKKKLSKQKMGNKNPQWVDKNPSYSSVHKWLDRNFKKIKKCEHCSSSKFIEWALKSNLKHDHKRENYLCLCSSCHKKYDYTPERRKKLSESLKKVIHTKEWIEKVAQANRGRKLSEDHRKKISEYQKQHKRPRDKYGRFF